MISKWHKKFSDDTFTQTDVPAFLKDFSRLCSFYNASKSFSDLICLSVLKGESLKNALNEYYCDNGILINASNISYNKGFRLHFQHDLDLRSYNLSSLYIISQVDGKLDMRNENIVDLGCLEEVNDEVYFIEGSEIEREFKRKFRRKDDGGYQRIEDR